MEEMEKWKEERTRIIWKVEESISLDEEGIFC